MVCAPKSPSTSPVVVYNDETPIKLAIYFGNTVQNYVLHWLVYVHAMRADNTPPFGYNTSLVQFVFNNINQ